MRKLLDIKNYTITKLAMNACISDSSVNAYLNGQKLPCLTTLVSLANYLNYNLDFLLGRTDNTVPIDKLNAINSDSVLVNNIVFLPKNKQKLVEAYVKGLMDN